MDETEIKLQSEIKTKLFKDLADKLDDQELYTQFVKDEALQKQQSLKLLITALTQSFCVICQTFECVQHSKQERMYYQHRNQFV